MFNGLSEFMKGDGTIAVSAIAVLMLVGAWRKSDWTKVASVLLIYGIIMSVIQGTAILSFIGSVLRWFGIETGL